ncbi:MAG: thiol-activated cytolysin family protein, partial [Gemmatimonadota bacterium]
MASRARLFALPVGVAFASFVIGCSDSNPTVPEGSVADVEEYLLTLPSWSEFAEPVPDAQVVAAEPSYYEQSSDLFCSVTEASITRNPEDIVTYSPDSEILWLGSLIQGRTHRDGLGSLLEVPVRQRGPLTVSIDILFSDNTRVVENPTLATVGQAIGELIDAAHAAGHLSGSSIFFNQVESHSLEQSALQLGLSAHYMTTSVRSSLSADRTAASSSLTATFVQKMFTTSMVLPQAPRDVFGPDLTEPLLQEQVDFGNIGPHNLPVYVGSITWGRMLTVTLTSEHTAAEMKAALSASSSFGGFDVNVAADVKHKKVLDESEIRVVAIGGHAQAAIDLIRTGELGEYFKEDAPLTTARPISYVLRNLGDNSIAKVSETTSYAIRECQPGGVQRYSNYTAWRDALADTSVVGPSTLIEDSLLTTASNIGLATELAAAPGGNANIGPRITF